MKIKHRWMAWMVALAMCSVAVACDDGEDGMDAGGDEVDAGGDDGTDAGDMDAGGGVDAGDTDAGDTDAGDMDAGGGVDAGDTDAGDTDAGDTDAGDTDAGGDVDAGPVEPSLSAENQTLTLSTVVTVAEASSDGPGWVVIHEDDGGNPGDIIGAGLLASGAQTNIEVALDRPAENNEPLHAMLHIDADELGTFDSSTDTPVLVDDAPVTVSFLVTVPEGTPAIRVTVEAIGNSAWNFTGAEPARYADTIGEEAENQTLTLRHGWRYEIVNMAAVSIHPFQFISSLAGSDTVELSQGVTDGDLEGDAEVAFEDDTPAIRFTVDPSFRTPVIGVSEYRCGIHTAAMRGPVQYMTP